MYIRVVLLHEEVGSTVAETTKENKEIERIKKRRNITNTCYLSDDVIITQLRRFVNSYCEKIIKFAVLCELSTIRVFNFVQFDCLKALN